MKKTILILIVLSLFINSCSKSSSDDVPTTPQNPCAGINSFTVVQQNDMLVFNINSSTTPLYYEVSYQNATSNPDPNNGYKFIINGLTTTMPISNIVSTGTYVFYIRAICSSSSSSDWSSAQVLTIANYCDRPTNVNFSGSGNYLSWTNYTSSSVNCQVQYGISGFTIGTGTTINVSGNYTSGFMMNGNTTYDFYVRSYCSTTSAWTAWSNVTSYLNTVSACNLPSNLAHQIESITSTVATVSLHWTYNGGTNFEYMVVNHGASIATATIYTATNNGWPTWNLGRSGTYDFYMRTVCSNGTKTAWTTPYLISNL